MKARKPRRHEGALLGALGLCVIGLFGAVSEGVDFRLLDRPTAASSDAAAAALASISDQERKSARMLNDAFDRMGYDLAAVHNGTGEVPRVYFAHLPRDLHALDDIDLRKQVFLRALLPVVLQVNEEILADRQRLLYLKAKTQAGRELTDLERYWLNTIAAEYRMSKPHLPDLLKLVDEVPVSMALAQAIEESGWGTSKLARESNALFGQFGMTEQDGRTVWDYRSFETLTDTVRAYARNLNTHRAYREFRRHRSVLRARGVVLDGHDLAGHLVAYSERGDAYVSTLRSIIRANGLDGFDRARLNTHSAGLLRTAAFFRQ